MRRYASIFSSIGILILLASVSWGQARRTLRSYRIGPKDLVQVRVFEEPDLNVERRVAVDGTILLPLVGELLVEGMTEAELSSVLEGTLEESYLQRATVTVEVIEIQSNPISVIGAVQRPGRLNVAGQLTLLEALNEAGGLTATSGDLIRVLRTADNGLTDQVEISIDDLLSGQRPQVNISIFPNDLISVPGESTMTIYLLGEVGKRGEQTFDGGERVTLLMAISRAGGLTDRAANKITIKRSDGADAEELVVNYKQVLKGKVPDVLLRDRDLIIVRESFF